MHLEELVVYVFRHTMHKDVILGHQQMKGLETEW